MKTYCCMFIRKDSRKLVYEYFNKLTELEDYLEKNEDLDLLSLQRIWAK